MFRSTSQCFKIQLIQYSVPGYSIFLPLRLLRTVVTPDCVVVVWTNVVLLATSCFLSACSVCYTVCLSTVTSFPPAVSIQFLFLVFSALDVVGRQKYTSFTSLKNTHTYISVQVQHPPSGTRSCFCAIMMFQHHQPRECHCSAHHPNPQA